MPMARAVSFISAAKASTEPEMPSAMVIDVSFADFTMMIFSAFSSVTSVPGLKPIFEGTARAARLETRNGVSSVILPSRTLLSAT